MVCPIHDYASHTAELGLFRRSPKLRSTVAQKGSMATSIRRLSSRTCRLGRETECNARSITRVLPSLSRFSVYIAREFRTPINNIRGKAEVVLTRARSVGKYRETVTSSLEENVRLLELIEPFIPGASRHARQSTQTREDRCFCRTRGLCEYYEAATQESATSAFHLLHRSGHGTPPGGSIALTS